MLFATQPDKLNDMHQHQIELDEFGDGITDEGGDPPHVHEVGHGLVLPFTEGGYVSSHPGVLMLLDGEQEGMEQPETEQADTQEDDEDEGQYTEAIEAAIDALEEAQENDADSVDPLLDEVVTALLYGGL